MASNLPEKTNMSKRDDCSDLNESYFAHPFQWVATPIHPFGFLRSAWTWMLAGAAIISVTAFVVLR